MKITIKTKLPLLIAAAFAAFATPRPAMAAPLTQADTTFLAEYEKIRAALADDDLATAKKSAAALGDAGATLAASKNLEEARTAFVTLSATAEKLASGQSGYYVLYCPMVKHDWVQTTPAVGNPYGGREMKTCGSVK